MYMISRIGGKKGGDGGKVKDTMKMGILLYQRDNDHKKKMKKEKTEKAYKFTIMQALDVQEHCVHRTRKNI